MLATVERLVSTEKLKELGGANVAYFYVTAVTEVGMGAHPTACYPFYAYDRPHTALYYQAAKAGPKAFHERYLAPFVFDCANHTAYLDRIGGDAARTRLSSWHDGTAAWQRLYTEGVS